MGPDRQNCHHLGHVSRFGAQEPYFLMLQGDAEARQEFKNLKFRSTSHPPKAGDSVLGPLSFSRPCLNSDPLSLLSTHFSPFIHLIF